MRRLPLLLSLALAAGACGADAGDGAEIRDSAGVRIVVNPAPAPDGPRFTLSAEPLAAIGLVEGAPEYQLTRPSAVRLADGTIVVFNGGTQELRFFDGDGRYLPPSAVKARDPASSTGAAWGAVSRAIPSSS